MASIPRRFIGVGLVLAWAVAWLTACSSSVKQAGAGEYDAIQALARGGVAVTDEVTSQTPVAALSGQPSAMRFTRWQIRTLVAEANAHGGYLGSELDALAAPPPGVPSFSMLVSAWLTRNEGPLANYASGFMNAPDYKHTATIVFPSIVVLSFIADVARPSAAAAAKPTAFDLGPYIATPALADGGPCSLASSWVSSVIANVTAAIQANGSGWLSQLWNTLVSIAGTAISVTINAVTQPLLGFVTRIASITATLMQLSSMFKPWTVKLTADPTVQTLDTTPQTGTFDATLDAQPIPWPAVLKDCVSTLSGTALDDAGYKDAPITWSYPVGIPTLASNTSKDDTLLENKTAHYAYSTITSPNPEDAQCQQLVTAGNVGITVTVARSDVTKVLTSLESLVTNELPSGLRTYLLPYIQPALTDANAAAAKFRAPHATATVKLQELVADPLCTHTPPPTTSPTGAPLHAHAPGLPLVPCDQLISDADVAPYLDGATNIDSAISDDDKKAVRAIMALAGTYAKGPTEFRGDLATICFLGHGGGKTAEVSAIFWVSPPGSTPYTAFTADPSDPNDCITAFGADLLARFSADCHGLIANNLFTIQSATAQYGLTALPPAPTPAQGALMNVMRHLLNRL
jgi:hypothetical protein